MFAELWENCQYQVLLQETDRCDKSLGRLHPVSEERQQADRAHTSRVFHRLMIQGKTRATVRWITEREKAGLLEAKDLTKVKTSDGCEFEMTVLEALQLKHPEPGRSASHMMIHLRWPPVELDMCGGHIQMVARWLRGGAGPGGSDSTAWQDWLLRYGAHSEHLRDAVARLTSVVANSLMPFHFIRALISSRLVAVDKCPGVRPIGGGGGGA